MPVCLNICVMLVMLLPWWQTLHTFFFFKQKTAYELRISDWSSDVRSSDLRFRTIAVAIQRFETQTEIVAADPQRIDIADTRRIRRHQEIVGSECTQTSVPRHVAIVLQKRKAEIGRAHV